MEDKTKSRYIRSSAKFTATCVCLALLLIACQKPAEKPGIAAETIVSENQRVQGASRDVRPAWRESWLKFKRETDRDIAENERRIVKLRKDVGKANPRFRPSYNIRIDELERRNKELRHRTDNYRDEGDARLAAFKLGFKRDMDSLKVLLQKTIIKDG